MKKLFVAFRVFSTTLTELTWRGYKDVGERIFQEVQRENEGEIRNKFMRRKMQEDQV